MTIPDGYETTFALDDPNEREATGPESALMLPPPNVPMEVAREFAKACYQHPAGAPTVRHWRGGWWEWRGARWVEVEQRAMAAAAYRFTERAQFESSKGLQSWAPNRYKVADLLAALAAIAHLPEDVSMPTWLDGTAYDGLLVSCLNGLLDVNSRAVLEHTPLFFNGTSVPFAYDPRAARPVRWRTFLNELWPGDPESCSVLQEWFGYVISGRLDLHKILLLIGPTRAGKGVIARMLSALIGHKNVAGPTLTSLNKDFGLAPLLGKSLAVISDARLNGRNAHVVVERLLSISGEGTLTVNRKYREQWTGKLPTRIMLCSNELPQLGDASMAIAGRFVPLLLSRSWLGHEDHGLEPTLNDELPGVLNWALDGLKRLSEKHGRFSRASQADEAIIALQDLASPVAAFVRDRCVRGPQHEVALDDLYTHWRLWAEDKTRAQHEAGVRAGPSCSGAGSAGQAGGRTRNGRPRAVVHGGRVEGARVRAEGRRIARDRGRCDASSSNPAGGTHSQSHCPWRIPANP